MHRIPRRHLFADFVEQVERAKRITRSLNKQNWRLQFAQDLVAQFCAITAAAERIAEANHARDFFLERYMTTNPATHAFADQKYLAGCFLAYLHESLTMGRDKLGWRMGRLWASWQ